MDFLEFGWNDNLKCYVEIGGDGFVVAHHMEWVRYVFQRGNWQFALP